MGKTALIHHFFHHLNKEKQAEGIYVDLLGTSSLSEANRKIAEAIIKQFVDMRKGLGSRILQMLGSIGATLGIDPVTGMPQLTFGHIRNHDIPASLEAIGRFLNEKKTPVIICIDEFQQVINYPEKSAEATFRTWIQNFPMVRFVFLGSQRHMMISMFSEKTRPFYRSTQLMQLDPLPEKEYMKFIRSFFRKYGKSIDPTQINIIFNWTRMQTYYVQLVCNKLFGRKDQLDDDVVIDVFSEIIQQEIPLFSAYQKLLTKVQWKLLVAISKAEEVSNPYSQEFLTKYGLGAASSINAALDNLIRKELVIHHNQKYTLHDTLLMRWLQQL